MDSLITLVFDSSTGALHWKQVSFNINSSFQVTRDKLK